MGLRRPKNTKNPPVFSHEFVIQNHADIVSCVAMVFVVGLMFQVSAPVASLFIGVNHNVTVNGTDDSETDFLYTNGLKDLFNVFFYLLILIIIHAVVQEYILDKVNRKMHLSKTKHSKFNESGQLLFFYVVSLAWGVHLVLDEEYATNISKLWEDYPHSLMPFLLKFFFLIQIAYWIHCFPELYFQKTKKEEMPARVQYALLYTVFIVAAYSLNFTRVALCMLVFHYLVEAMFHLARMMYFAEKNEIASTLFGVWNVMFVIVRLITITLAILTFWYGLEQSGSATLNIEEGNFNTQIIRINCLAAVCMMQAWMMWNFITFHLKRWRERVPAAKKAPAAKRPKKSKGKVDDESSQLSDSDQDAQENGSAVKTRASKKRN